MPEELGYRVQAGEPGVFVEIYLPKRADFQGRLHDALTQGFDLDAVREREGRLVHLAAAASSPVANMRTALGLAYAGLGRKQEAIREARRAMELVPLSTNTLAATAAMAGAAQVFVQAGETDEALELLELLLGMPAGHEVSVSLLRNNPAYHPLRGHPRFEKLLERFSLN